LDALRFSLSCGGGGTRRFGLTKRKQKQQVVVKMRVNTAASCACFSRETATTESNMGLHQSNQNKMNAKNAHHPWHLRPARIALCWQRHGRQHQGQPEQAGAKLHSMYAQKEHVESHACTQKNLQICRYFIL